MEYRVVVAVRNLTAAVAVAAVVLAEALFGGDAWYRPIAIAALAVVAAPIVLLVSIDTGRVLTSRSRSSVLRTLGRVPEFILGALELIGAIAATYVAASGSTSGPLWRLLAEVAALLLAIVGVLTVRSSIVRGGRSPNV
jgi:hypothetical protein